MKNMSPEQTLNKAGLVETGKVLPSPDLGLSEEEFKEPTTPAEEGEEEEAKISEKEIEAELERLGLKKDWKEVKPLLEERQKALLAELAEIEKDLSQVKTFKQWRAVQESLGEASDYLVLPGLDDLNDLSERVAKASQLPEKEEWERNLSQAIKLIETIDDPVNQKFLTLDKRLKEDFQEFQLDYELALSYFRNYRGRSLEETKKEILGVAGNEEYPGVLGDYFRLRNIIQEKEKRELEEAPPSLKNLLAFLEKKYFPQAAKDWEIEEKAIKQSVGIAKEILSDPEEAQLAFHKIVRQIKEDKAVAYQELKKCKFGDRRERGVYLRRLEQLAKEEAEVRDLSAEAGREFLRDPRYSAENIEAYTLAQAFNAKFWPKGEAEDISKMAKDYLVLANKEIWSEERKEKLRELIRIVWHRANLVVCGRVRFDEKTGKMILKSPNLDSQACLGLFSLAGIPREEFPSASDRQAAKSRKFKGGYTCAFPPGKSKKVMEAIVLNLGEEEGVFSPVKSLAKRFKAENGPLTPEFFTSAYLGKKEKLARGIRPMNRVLWCDHHASVSGPDSSAAKYLFEAFKFLNFFEENDPFFKNLIASRGYDKKTIEETIKFVTEEDNKNNEDWLNQKAGWWEKSSWCTILGLASRLSFDQLLYLVKDKGIKNFTDELTKAKIEQYDDGFVKERDWSDEQIKKYKEQQSLKKKSNQQRNFIGEAGKLYRLLEKKPFTRWERGGGASRIYLTESPRYGKVVFTTGGFRGGIDAVRGLFGPNAAYVFYNSNSRSIFISTAGEKLPNDLLGLGKKLRERMWIVPEGPGFPFTIREVLERLEVSEEAVKQNTALWETMMAEETDEKILKEAARKYFFKFWQSILKATKAEPLEVRKKLGDRLFYLLQGKIGEYLNFVSRKWPIANAADSGVLERLKEKSLPILKEAILKIYQAEGKTEADLKADLGPAFDELFNF